LNQILVGTASWADPSLVKSGLFYPKSAKSAEDRLRHYARSFSLVEVDSSYYAIPSPHAAALWNERTPDTFIFNLPAMTVNLNSDGEGEQFMKLTVALEVASEEVMLEIQPRMGKVVDAFQVYLRELRKSDLEGSAGIYRLKEELQRRVNVAVYPAQVESVLFKEILVQ